MAAGLSSITSMVAISSKRAQHQNGCYDRLSRRCGDRPV